MFCIEIGSAEWLQLDQVLCNFCRIGKAHQVGIRNPAVFLYRCYVPRITPLAHQVVVTRKEGQAVHILNASLPLVPSCSLGSSSLQQGAQTGHRAVYKDQPADKGLEIELCQGEDVMWLTLEACLALRPI